MKTIMLILKNLFKTVVLYLLKNRGAGATEYGLIIAGVALALIFVFFVLTDAFNYGFEVIINALNNVFN